MKGKTLQPRQKNHGEMLTSLTWGYLGSAKWLRG
jgi:hypothetical protein